MYFIANILHDFFWGKTYSIFIRKFTSLEDCLIGWLFYINRNNGKNVMRPYFRPYSRFIINARSIGYSAILNGSTWICGHSYLRLTKIIKPPISIKQIALWKRSWSLLYNYISVPTNLSCRIVFQYISIVSSVVARLVKHMLHEEIKTTSNSQ